MNGDKIQVLFESIISAMPQFRKSFSRPHFIFSEGKLSPHEHFCFMIIDKKESISMTELAKKLGVSNQQVTRIVNSLVKLDLVKRAPSEENRRLILAKLSENGKETVKIMKKKFYEDFKRRLGALTENEINESIEHIDALKKIFSKLSD